MNLTEHFQSDIHPWVVPGLTAAAIVLLGLAVHAIALPLIRRVLKFNVYAATVVEFISRPARFVIPLFALQLLWEAYRTELPYLPAVRLMTALLLTAALTWVAMRAVAGIAEAVIRRHPVDMADNLQARRVQTQVRVIARAVTIFVLLLGFASALMLFPGVRHIGASLLASAGVAGLLAGIAARPVLANLIAGLQIAIAQPLRLGDEVIIEGEWGRIEEITSTYVVVAIWDQRRLVVPLQWVIEHPFQNWTRTSSELLGTVLLWVDYATPLAPLRAELERVCAAAPEWDRRLALLQVVETSERAVQLRCLVSAANSGKTWDLRCRVREALIDFLQREYPHALPRLRAEIGRQARSSAESPSADKITREPGL